MIPVLGLANGYNFGVAGTVVGVSMVLKNP
jgi:hypothetical protein